MKRITVTHAALDSAVQMLQDHIDEAPNEETKQGVIALGEALSALYYGNSGNSLTIVTP
jgi:hypothetical protein